MSTSKAPYSSFIIANCLLGKSKDIDPLKLQKLTYYAHGWHLAFKGGSLINEPIEAWPYGPVVVSIYEEFKKFGYNAITDKALDWDYAKGSFFPPELPKEDSFVNNLVDAIWDNYGGMTGIQLSNATHAEGTPWSQIWDDTGCKVIPNSLIKEYFESRVTQAAS